MITRENLIGGMSEVLPAENLPAGVCTLIQNMSLGKDGIWTAIQQPRSKDEIQFETKHAYAWQPVYMPTGAMSGEDTVYIYFGSGACMVWYKTGETNGVPNYDMQMPVNSGIIDMDNLRVSYDSQQFVFVDGRENRGAQRLTIDSEGVIHCRRFGTEQPKTFPIIRQIDNDKYADNTHTGMPIGSILYYCYCIVNEYGERSNPSPVKVCDTAQWLAKGDISTGTYQYSDVNAGSIKSVSVECAIPQPDEAKTIELYRASAEYFESQKPLDPMRLVLSQTIPRNTDTITVKDTAFASAIEVDYENDSAPAGDDIVLDNGTVFIANAVSESAFAYPVDKVWTITLNNKNSINYANRWFAIDVRDEDSVVCNFVGLTNSDLMYDGDSHRFIDSDMITPLTAYGTKTRSSGGTGFSITSGGSAYHFDTMFIQIPYLPANTTKTIYLVEYSDTLTGYGHSVYPLTTTAEKKAYFDSLVDSPVRDENCMISVGKEINTPTITDGWNGELINKANALWTADKDNYAETEISTGIVQVSDIVGLVARQSDGNSFEWFEVDDPAPDTNDNPALLYSPVDGMEPNDSGYFYTFINFAATGQVTDTIGGDYNRLLNIDFDERALDVYISKAENKLKFEIGGTEVLIYTFPGSSGQVVGMFLFLSWRKSATAGDGVDYNTDLKVATLIVVGSSTQPIYTEYHGTIDRKLTSLSEPAVRLMTSMTSDSPFWFNNFGIGYWYFNTGEYIDNDYEILALSRFDTHFPNEPIGVRDHSLVSIDKYLTNSNIDIEVLQLANDKKPGKIRWSNGGAVPDLYEHNIYEEVKRILPVRSFQPTDEHNTLLIWTDKNLLRMALTGNNKDASALITEIKGIGLQDRDAIVQVSDGIIWAERTGVYYLSASGLKEIGKGRITLSDFTVLYNQRKREVLYVKSDVTAMVYNLDWDAWSKVDYGMTPEGFIEFDGVWCLLTASGTYELEPVDDDTTLIPKILTRKIPARNKINRLTLHSSGGIVKAYVYNHRLPGGYSVTPEYTLTGDDPKAIPQLSGDYVQFEIVTDSINNFDVEDRNGK